MDGSVFLFPITDSFEFRSVGEAAYINDLAQEDSGAVLSGMHSVHGPAVFEHPVQGPAGKYDYVLEGPAQPRACYGTTLHVIADPPDTFDTIDVTFTGDTKCAPRELQKDLPDDPVATCPGCCPYSPVIISERGDYRLTSVVDGVTFDIDADGMAERVSWTAPGSDLAFITLDRNRNGRIDSGAELFGDAIAANGWEALAELDGNGDGVINAHDTEWRDLLLWYDRDHDGSSTPAELLPVSTSSITSIGTAYRWVGRRDAFGNMFRYAGQITLAAGPRQAYDIYFLAR